MLNFVEEAEDQGDMGMEGRWKWLRFLPSGDLWYYRLIEFLSTVCTTE